MRLLTALATFGLLGIASAFAQNSEAPFMTMKPEQQRAFEIDVMEKVADLALISPKPAATSPPHRLAMVASNFSAAAITTSSISRG